LTGSYRAAAELAGCSHHPVARLVASGTLIDEFLPRIEEWVEKSQGKYPGRQGPRGTARMGFTGSPQSSRRAVARSTV